eukprot:GHVQ01042578.1.p1 GENE.GHVQ01042578.1~~GHVQ01042578.1.p1  ORF type:complete len:637 (-),score=87.75 GHVQ01042578.1:472-2382(-)
MYPTSVLIDPTTFLTFLDIAPITTAVDAPLGFRYSMVRDSRREEGSSRAVSRSPAGAGGGKDARTQQYWGMDPQGLAFLQQYRESEILRIGADKTVLDVVDYAQYLNINLQLEPSLVWVAREMLAAPLPTEAEMHVSRSGVVYFRDKRHDIYTVEHPFTQRYLKVLERARLHLLATRLLPDTHGLALQQPTVLFHQQYKNLQIACEDCGVCQSVVSCQQCLMSFCDSCFTLLHNKSNRSHHVVTKTAIGSECSSCSRRKPQCFCASCEDFFCHSCYDELHQKGGRQAHQAVAVAASDGELVDTKRRCDECDDRPATFLCNNCTDYFCLSCFWAAHSKGNRRFHRVTKASLNPLCWECEKTRASVFCLQCSELYCTECFTHNHKQGNRKVHLFVDAMNFLHLLEITDPPERIEVDGESRVYGWICCLQAWARGVKVRNEMKKKHDMCTIIQKVYRGHFTRVKVARFKHRMAEARERRRRKRNNQQGPPPTERTSPGLFGSDQHAQGQQVENSLVSEDRASSPDESRGWVVGERPRAVAAAENRAKQRQIKFADPLHPSLAESVAKMEASKATQMKITIAQQKEDRLNKSANRTLAEWSEQSRTVTRMADAGMLALQNKDIVESADMLPPLPRSAMRK